MVTLERCQPDTVRRPTALSLKEWRPKFVLLYSQESFPKLWLWLLCFAGMVTACTNDPVSSSARDTRARASSTPSSVVIPNPQPGPCDPLFIQRNYFRLSPQPVVVQVGAQVRVFVSPAGTGGGDWRIAERDIATVTPGTTPSLLGVVTGQFPGTTCLQYAGNAGLSLGYATVQVVGFGAKVTGPSYVTILADGSQPLGTYTVQVGGGQGPYEYTFPNGVVTTTYDPFSTQTIALPSPAYGSSLSTSLTFVARDLGTGLSRTVTINVVVDFPAPPRECIPKPGQVCPV